MAIFRIDQIRKMSTADRMKNIGELNKRLLKHHSKIASGGNVENPGEIREIRKTIARILTIEHEARLETEKKAET